MPETAPIEELRIARAALRIRLERPELTDGPWLSLDDGDRLIRDQPGDEDQAPVYVVNEPMSNGANAMWIEVMHPGVGRVLLGWLDDAYRFAQGVTKAHGHLTATAVHNLRHELAFARLINDRP